MLEQDPHYVGGISRTAHYKGFLFDIGGHRFFSKSKEVVDLWNEILPDDFIERPRLSRIYYGGKFYAYPLRAFEALTISAWSRAPLCMASFGWAKAAPVKDPTTFHQWVRNQFGERLFSHLLQDLHREGVGHELRRDLGRLGGPAHQGPGPAGRGPRRGEALAGPAPGRRRRRAPRP